MKKMKKTMMTLLRRFLPTVAMAGVMTIGHAADSLKPQAGQAAVSQFKKTPTIDGKIEEGEWDGAVATTGFQAFQGNGCIDARNGQTYFGFSKERLYFAMRSEIPPDGKLQSEKTNRDAELIWDEGIEIWIDPNRDRRESGEGDQRFFNFIGNSIGTILDAAIDPKKGSPDLGWNADWEFANTVDAKAGWWTLELSVPIEQLGLHPEKLVGSSVGIVIARNYKAGGWLQGPWFPHPASAFVNWAAYPRIHLTKDSPSVQIRDIGKDVFKGELQLAAKVVNPGTSRKVLVDLHIISTDMPELRETREIALSEGAAMDYSYVVPPQRLHEQAQHLLRFQVLSPDRAATYLDYSMAWRAAPSNKWPGVHVGPRPFDAVKTAFYPSLNLLRVLANPVELGEKMGAERSAVVTLMDANGKTLMSEKMSWDKAPAEQVFQIPKLAAGDYRIAVKFPSWPEAIEHRITRKIFPWEGNELGITEKIHPPFLPITVKENNVNVVLRQYGLDGLGLWSSIKAAGNVSAGGEKEILARPMELRINDGEVLKGKGKFVTQKAHEVVYQGEANGPGVQVSTRTSIEYDGCMKVELTLKPGQKKEALQSLWLEIPLKDEEAPLWHASTTALRFNPVGQTPAGTGEVWNSKQFSDGEWYGSFRPYLWVGGEERGLCWFADNDKGWELAVDDKNPAASVPALQMLRKDGALTIRVNLIQRPITLEAPRTITFGLMASPGKPMNKEWRKTTFGTFNTPERKAINWMGSQYWGSDHDFAGKYPRNRDYAVLDAMRDLRRGLPVDTEAVVKGFDERNFLEGMPTLKPREQMLGLAKESMNQASRWQGGNYAVVYWDEFHSTHHLHEEVETFKNEWSGTYGYGPIGHLVRSHQDFAVWYGAELVKRGIGLYFDNAFPKRGYDPLTTSAYRLPNGNIQPSASMWAHREFLKRIWNIHQELGPKDIPPIMMIHMTNTHILPYMVWNESNLDLEWFFGPEPAQSKYPHEMLRAQSLGRQTGNIPLVLARVEAGTSIPYESEQGKKIACNRLIAMMVHEIKPDPNGGNCAMMHPILKFGYGMDDCLVWNYWDAGHPVRSDDPQVKTLLLKRGGELMLLLATWNSAAAVVELSIDEKTTGIRPKDAWELTVDDEKRALPLQDGKLRLSLEGYDTRLIRLK